MSTEEKGSTPQSEEHWQSSLVAALPAVSWQSYSVLYNVEYYISTTLENYIFENAYFIFYTLLKIFESIKMTWKAEMSDEKLIN